MAAILPFIINRTSISLRANNDDDVDYHLPNGICFMRQSRDSLCSATMMMLSKCHLSASFLLAKRFFLAFTSNGLKENFFFSPFYYCYNLEENENEIFFSSTNEHPIKVKFPSDVDIWHDFRPWKTFFFFWFFLRSSRASKEFEMKLFRWGWTLFFFNF